ncbi:hypothetical protein PRZ48_000475 [Zasmidium cellare]|uniref:Cysteine-rich transmembrane domain-containing protein n=1 Tax=Zasmidium cellare TaxID=395010 RepID=A0ABR0EYL0_ZASCE|nr:hypothetical protein PRZ48_000475 [Zasmidium cellare]
MSNQGYYGGQPQYGQPQYPPQSYGGYPQGPPPQQPMQYYPPQQQAPPPRQSKDRGCLGACLATLCCCFVCEEGLLYGLLLNAQPPKPSCEEKEVED